jgi:hypothetical protein
MEMVAWLHLSLTHSFSCGIRGSYGGGPPAMAARGRTKHRRRPPTRSDIGGWRSSSSGPTFGATSSSRPDPSSDGFFGGAPQPRSSATDRPGPGEQHRDGASSLARSGGDVVRGRRIWQWLGAGMPNPQGCGSGGAARSRRARRCAPKWACLWALGFFCFLIH